jgi:predicted 3-demethylubiquinone-9 3-methyltransferase (glyoxalase superfamily)
MQKIIPNLWFDGNAEEAVNFYVSIFKNSRIGRISHYGEAGKEIHGQPAGRVMTIEFEIEGQGYLALNGGPDFKFTEAVSFIVKCANQEEIDYYWNKLIDGGDPSAQICGWLKDKYGLSWQISPTIIEEMLADPDAAKRDRVMNALLKMKKIVIAELEEAYSQSD